MTEVRLIRMAASGGRKTSSSSKKTTSTTTGRKSSTARKKKTNTQSMQDSALFHEIGLIVLFVAMVFLFCCNLGLIGTGGNAVSGVLFGLFGWSAYILPVLVFLAAAFWFANEGSPNAVRKLVAGIVLFVMFCILCDLLAKQAGSMEKYDIKLLYEGCRDNKSGGGILAGSISFLLQQYLETIGTVLVLLLCSVVSLILLTEKSLLSSVKRGGSRMRELSREDSIRRREQNAIRRQEQEENTQRRREQNAIRRQEQEEQRARKAREQEEQRSRKAKERRLRAEEKENEKILRMEKKVSGVMLDTALTRPEDKSGYGDDIHEIILPEEEAGEGMPYEETYSAEPMEASVEEPVETVTEPQAEEEWIEEPVKETKSRKLEFDFEKIPIRGMHQVILNDEAEDPGDYGEESFGMPDAWDAEQSASRMAQVGWGSGQGEGRTASDGWGAEPGENRMSSDAGSPEESAGGMEPGAGSPYEDSRRSAAYEDSYRTAAYEEAADSSRQKAAWEEAADSSSQKAAWEEAADSSSQKAAWGDTADSSRQKAAWEDTVPEEAQPSPFGRNQAPPMGTGFAPRPAPPSQGSSRPAGGPTASLNTAGAAGSQMPENGFNGLEKEMSEAEKSVPKKYMLPPLDLLQKGQEATGDSARELRETAMRLQQTLETFGVRVTITEISQGPSVTRYELQPEQGVKVSKIVGLSDDIKMHLAATDIRIEAPIPGKAAIGIEVPNKETMAVALRDLLESSEFQDFPSNIAFAVGKDIAGKAVVSDIAKMPHMLIAGATGSGKSVCINTLIMSILYKAHPDDVKLIMVDPKVVELSIYNGIPHLLVPVVTDPKKASAALHWGVAEMEDRYRKFAEYNVRDLKGYNKKVEAKREKGDPDAPAKLPQIVIIVDELADLMMVCPGEVEESICRLAQLARACGIHLIIATQRPSVDVITGLIKANMPSRVAFSVSSGVDSRTILDMVGAEKLLGKGDMLFYPQGYPKPARVQGAFVSDQEVSDVVDFLKNQVLGNTYAVDVEEKIMNIGSTGGKGSGGSDVDELFEKAGHLIIDKDKASIGMLQRALQIGFNRAARIMDQLCQYGVVGEEEGTKPRKILMSPEQFDQMLEEVG
nr:DNA translocase FtsK 4TM domain-containing protein [uncultured Acetatifactor sp.]